MTTSTPKISMVPMGPLERDAVLALAGARHFPGSWAKRFSRDLAVQVEAGLQHVSIKQLYWIWKLAHRFRRQMPANVRQELESRMPGARRQTDPGWRQPLLWE